MFRWTCAQSLLRSGADVFSVQLLLGHSDLAVLRRYLDQTPEDVLAVHAKVVA
jgi:integrase/recombinase XerD